eukprot:1402240-Amphidinium_carterae.2
MPLAVQFTKWPVNDTKVHDDCCLPCSAGSAFELTNVLSEAVNWLYKTCSELSCGRGLKRGVAIARNPGA